MINALHGPISCVTLDWGDTLVANYGMPYGFVHDRALNALASALTAAGGTVDAQWIEASANELHELWVGSAQPEINPENKEFDYDGLLGKWVAATGLERSQPAVAEALQVYGATVTDTICPFAEAGEALAELHGMGLRIGILSHVPWPGWACRAWYERKGWAPYIDFYSLSCDVGYIKPHPAHYQNTLDQANCPAAHIAHVGDHPQRDVVGAREYGMQTILKVTQGIYADEDLIGCDPHAAIAHVRELPALIRPHLAT